jgi:hypothetical protein
MLLITACTQNIDTYPIGHVVSTGMYAEKIRDSP